MKYFKYAALLLCAGLTFASCSEDEDEKFEKDYMMVTFEGTYWDGLIDSPQMKGEMLYGDGSYNWFDQTTSLSSKLTNAWGDGQFWGGGIAISNYVYPDYKQCTGSEYQLSVPASNGTKNFAVAYCEASMSFGDGNAREIKSMDICPNNYTLGSIVYGDGYAAALDKKGDYLTIVVTADNDRVLNIDLARDGEIQKGWKTVDMTSLGAVKSLTFTMVGSDNSDWGVKSPTYFAFDNVVIKKLPTDKRK